MDHQHRTPPVARVDLAEQALRHFGDNKVTRDDAARLLSMWAGRWMLSADDEVELLARFEPTGAAA